VLEPLAGGKQTTMKNHNFIVLVLFAWSTWNKEYNTHYLYKLLTTFKVVPKFVHGLLPVIGKVA
jgi:hypothetical protein